MEIEDIYPEKGESIDDVPWGTYAANDDVVEVGECACERL